MRATVTLIVVCLVLSILGAQAQTFQPETPELRQDTYGGNYCSGLLGNSLAFAFASGVSVAVPVLSAGFLIASLAFAIAAVAVC